MEKLNISVLYVEDEPKMREEVGYMIGRWVKTLYTAENGKDGIEKFKYHAPDIILTDISMPIMNGLDMVSEIRKTSNVRVIVMTAYSEIDYFTKAIELGVDYFIIKPVLRKNIFEAINKTAKFVLNEKQLAKQEHELKEREAKYRNLFELSNDAILIIDTDGNIKDVNTAALKMLVYENSIITQKNVSELHPKDERDIVEQLLSSKNIINKNTLEATYIKSNGQPINVELSIGIVDETKSLKQIIVRDITQRKKISRELERYKNHLENIVSERTHQLMTTNNMLKNEIEVRKEAQIALAESEKKYKDIFNNVNDSIIILNEKSIILEANSNAYLTLGFTREEFVGLNLATIVVDYYHSFLQKKFSNKSFHKKSVFEVEFTNNRDITIPVEISYRQIIYNNENAILAIVRDISERKQMQRKILNTIISTEEKERDRFAKDLHDGIGSTLSSINIYINMLIAGSIKDEEKNEKLTIIKSLIDSAIQTAKETANNIRPNILNNFGLVEAIKSFCEKINLTKKIDIEFTAQNCFREVNEEVEIIVYRVVNELLNNTIKHSGANKAAINFCQDNNELIINYSDNGKGFDIEKTLASKELGMGVKNIISRVNSIRGAVNFSNNENGGSIVDIHIPILNNY